MLQKFVGPLVGAPLCGAPVRPNMLNMRKSASGGGRSRGHPVPLQFWTHWQKFRALPIPDTQQFALPACCDSILTSGASRRVSLIRSFYAWVLNTRTW